MILVLACEAFFFPLITSMYLKENKTQPRTEFHFLISFIDYEVLDSDTSVLYYSCMECQLWKGICYLFLCCIYF